MSAAVNAIRLRLTMGNSADNGLLRNCINTRLLTLQGKDLQSPDAAYDKGSSFKILLFLDSGTVGVVPARRAIGQDLLHGAAFTRNPGWIYQDLRRIKVDLGRVTQSRPTRYS